MNENTLFDIQEMILDGEMSFAEIAERSGVSISDVELIAEELNDQYDDSMDGDAASALASAGWGSDEDYVCDNDYFDDY